MTTTMFVVMIAHAHCISIVTTTQALVATLCARTASVTITHTVITVMSTVTMITHAIVAIATVVGS
jgi:hypothetical protein